MHYPILTTHTLGCFKHMHQCIKIIVRLLSWETPRTSQQCPTFALEYSDDGLSLKFLQSAKQLCCWVVKLQSVANIEEFCTTEKLAWAWSPNAPPKRAEAKYKRKHLFSKTPIFLIPFSHFDFLDQAFLMPKVSPGPSVTNMVSLPVVSLVSFVSPFCCRKLRQVLLEWLLVKRHNLRCRKSSKWDGWDIHFSTWKESISATGSLWIIVNIFLWCFLQADMDEKFNVEDSFHCACCFQSWCADSMLTTRYAGHVCWRSICLSLENCVLHLAHETLVCLKLGP